MATIDDIRRGLAANLRLVPDCLVSPYLLDSPTTPALQVAGFDTIDYLDSFGPGVSLRIIVEGATGLAHSRAAQARFDRWLWPTGADSVKAAIESDTRLTSRLSEDGKSVLADQDPACDALQVVEFRGYRQARVRDGVELLLGDWVVQVEAS